MDSLSTLQALVDALDPELEGALLQVPLGEATAAFRDYASTPQPPPALENALRSALQRLVMSLGQHAFRDFWSPEVSAAFHALVTATEQPTPAARLAGGHLGSGPSAATSSSSVNSTAANGRMPPRQSEIGRRSSGASFSGQSFNFDSVSMASSEIGPNNWATYDGKPQEFDRQSWISSDSTATVPDHETFTPKELNALKATWELINKHHTTEVIVGLFRRAFETAPGIRDVFASVVSLQGGVENNPHLLEHGAKVAGAVAVVLRELITGNGSQEAQDKIYRFIKHLAKAHHGRIPHRELLRSFCDALIFSVSKVLTEKKRMNPDVGRAWKHFIDYLQGNFVRAMHLAASEAVAPVVSDVSLNAARRVNYALEFPLDERARTLLQKHWKKIYTGDPSALTRLMTRHHLLFSATTRVLFLNLPQPKATGAAHEKQHTRDLLLVNHSTLFLHHINLILTSWAEYDVQANVFFNLGVDHLRFTADPLLMDQMACATLSGLEAACGGGLTPGAPLTPWDESSLQAWRIVVLRLFAPLRSGLTKGAGDSTATLIRTVDLYLGRRLKDGVGSVGVLKRAASVDNTRTMAALWEAVLARRTAFESIIFDKLFEQMPEVKLMFQRRWNTSDAGVVAQHLLGHARKITEMMDIVVPGLQEAFAHTYLVALGRQHREYLKTIDADRALRLMGVSIVAAAQRISPTWTPWHADMWTRAVESLLAPFLAGLHGTAGGDGDNSGLGAPGMERTGTLLVAANASGKDSATIFAARALGTASKIWKGIQKGGRAAQSEFFRRLFEISPEMHVIFDMAMRHRHGVEAVNVPLSIEYDPLLMMHAAKLFDTLSSVITTQHTMAEMIPHFERLAVFHLKHVPKFHDQLFDVFAAVLEETCAKLERWTPDKALALAFVYKQIVLPMREGVRRHRETEIMERLARRVKPEKLAESLDKLRRLLQSDGKDALSLKLHDQFFLLDNANYSCFVGRLDENIGRNRFMDIVPYDATRVILTPCKSNGHNDYINASYVNMKSANAVQYIAAQGPMGAVTAGLFWEMIWEREVEVIAMLCDEDSSAEQSPSNCFLYWPERPSEPQDFGDLRVMAVQDPERAPTMTRRMFVVHNLSTQTTRTVYHFQFTAWPDSGNPDVNAFVDFHIKVQNSWKNTASPRGPMLVHCAAGAGRTGTFIAVDVAMTAVANNDTLDLFNIAKRMRQCRSHMIFNPAQYQFAHEVVESSVEAIQRAAMALPQGEAGSMERRGSISSHLSINSDEYGANAVSSAASNSPHSSKSASNIHQSGSYPGPLQNSAGAGGGDGISGSAGSGSLGDVSTFGNAPGNNGSGNALPRVASASGGLFPGVGNTNNPGSIATVPPRSPDALPRRAADHRPSTASLAGPGSARDLRVPGGGSAFGGSNPNLSGGAGGKGPYTHLSAARGSVASQSGGLPNSRGPYTHLPRATPPAAVGGPGSAHSGGRGMTLEPTTGYNSAAGSSPVMLAPPVAAAGLVRTPSGRSYQSSPSTPVTPVAPAAAAAAMAAPSSSASRATAAQRAAAAAAAAAASSVVDI